MKILGIHHVTAAVRDLDEAREALAALFGAAAGPVDTIPAFSVRSTDLALGEGRLELVSPLGHDSAVQRYIERRGEGFYTLALEVEDLDAALRELISRGVRVSEPVESVPGERSAFITMAATRGLSIQLVETTLPATVAPPHPEPEAEQEPEQFAPQHAPRDLTPDEWSDVD
jgi:methylmalonyl-CoA/ethylmalonyl-CoA epimerase